MSLKALSHLLLRRLLHAFSPFLFITLFTPHTLFGQLQIPEGPIKFLALGDSYTIGQGVAPQNRWPVQLLDSLRSRGYTSDDPRIIATTGWRTDNLINAIKNQNLEDAGYNLVSVLIGVNNQFQNRPFSQYVAEFPALVDSAIRYAGGDRSRVFIVSIPDYAFTPVGQQSFNPDMISQQIDQYNAYNAHVADSMQVTYFNITPISRQGLLIPAYVANDGLHPSALQYTEWVKLMLAYIDQYSTSVIPELQDQKFDVSFFPNPVSGRMSFHLHGPPSSAIHQFRFYNLQGVMLYEDSLDGPDGQISIPHIPNGLYLVQIISGEYIVTKPMLIKH